MKKAESAKEGQSSSDSYILRDGTLEAKVTISQKENENIGTYALKTPKWAEGTLAFVDDLKSELLKKTNISSQEALNLKMQDELKAKFLDAGKTLVKESLPHLTEEQTDVMARKIVQDMFGLGDIEILLHDEMIEEICVNSSDQPVWIYHRKHGWITSDIFIPSENQIWNYATSIARGVGRQINTQTPLLDAYL